jgi:mRNA interferase MazF
MESKMNRGEVYWVNLNPSQGSEIRKRRPCVLVGATPINQARRTVIVVPLSTSAKPRPPLTIPVQCLGRSVVAVCDQIRAVDKSRLLEPAGSLSKEDMEAIEDGLRQVLLL